MKLELKYPVITDGIAYSEISLKKVAAYDRSNQSRLRYLGNTAVRTYIYIVIKHRAVGYIFSGIIKVR